MPVLSGAGLEKQREAEREKDGYARTDYRYIMAGFLKVEAVDKAAENHFRPLREPKDQKTKDDKIVWEDYNRILAQPESVAQDRIDYELAKIFTSSPRSRAEGEATHK